MPVSISAVPTNACSKSMNWVIALPPVNDVRGVPVELDQQLVRDGDGIGRVQQLLQDALGL